MYWLVFDPVARYCMHYSSRCILRVLYYTTKTCSQEAVPSFQYENKTIHLKPVRPEQHKHLLRD